MSNNILNESMFCFMGVDCADNRRLLDFLIDSEDALSEFVSKFYNGDAIESMMAYKNFKREVHSKDRQKFEMSINQGKIVEAFEQVFQEPLRQKDIDLIFKFKLTYLEVFERQKQFPHESFTNIVKGIFVELDSVDEDFLVEL